MTLRISPLLQDALPELQDLWDFQSRPYSGSPLSHDLVALARAHGQNVAIAWRGERPVGCVGWVTLGIAEDGCGYGSPLVAADLEAASALIDIVSERVRAAGAQRLRISLRAGETAKRDGLRQAGFQPLFEFVNFSRGLPFSAAPALPDGLRRIRLDDIDWGELHRCFAESFSGVPNSPIPDMENMREEWVAADQDASVVLADDSGRYQAFILIDGRTVEAVGVRDQWRSKGLAETLYQLAAHALASKQVIEMRALVAATNAASMRLHLKLGFTEYAPRWIVHELRLE
ncbi:MAG: GNAT family N-acetyltransferase [Collimonas sp.]|uniref:GNAT family N-acetyltransferase n=1 Tax=Collimonas sp. TaxID=1963772 RepID=UPI00326662AE